MNEAEQLEYEIMQKSATLAELRRQSDPVEVPNYRFATLDGEAGLSDLFAGRERLLVIHNMGQACRSCTLWADGINGIIRHLEDVMSVCLVSKDAPDVQRRMANDRGWRFRTASHGGGPYMTEQCGMGDYANMPGAAVYQMRDGKVVKTGRTFFGPGDLYSPMWHFLSLAGISHDQWSPQFHYWFRPEKMDDGGADMNDEG